MLLECSMGKRTEEISMLAASVWRKMGKRLGGEIKLRSNKTTQDNQLEAGQLPISWLLQKATAFLPESFHLSFWVVRR